MTKSMLPHCLLAKKEYCLQCQGPLPQAVQRFVFYSINVTVIIIHYHN